ncbi:MAG: hypothetical protein ACWA6X_08185 [Bauldia sp.]
MTPLATALGMAPLTAFDWLVVAGAGAVVLAGALAAERIGRLRERDGR